MQQTIVSTEQWSVFSIVLSIVFFNLGEEVHPPVAETQCPYQLSKSDGM